jgi:hypothetical protein
MFCARAYAVSSNPNHLYHRLLLRTLAAAESKLVHRMHEMASEAEHSKHMAEWTQQHVLKEHREQLKRMSTQKILAQPGMAGQKMIGATTVGDTNEEQEREIDAKFRESIVNSGVRVVPGSSLGVHHKIANFWQENPFKILAGIGIPSVLYIFRGKAGQEHLQMQMKVMHTRVLGQATVITMLLTLMGFKEYMDRTGKFITESDVEARVAQMQQSRIELLNRLQREKMEHEKVAEQRRKAHEADLKMRDAKKLLQDA